MDTTLSAKIHIQNQLYKSYNRNSIMGGYSYGEDSLFEAIDSHARVGARIFVPKEEVAWII